MNSSSQLDYSAFYPDFTAPPDVSYYMPSHGPTDYAQTAYLDAQYWADLPVEGCYPDAAAGAELASYGTAAL